MTIAKLLEMSQLPFEQERWERACMNEAKFGAMSGRLVPCHADRVVREAALKVVSRGLSDVV